MQNKKNDDVRTIAKKRQTSGHAFEITEVVNYL